MEQQTVTLIVGLGGVIVGGLITWVTNLFTNQQRFKHELEMLEKRLEHEERDRSVKIKLEKIERAFSLLNDIEKNPIKMKMCEIEKDKSSLESIESRIQSIDDLTELETIFLFYIKKDCDEIRKLRKMFNVIVTYEYDGNDKLGKLHLFNNISENKTASDDRDGNDEFYNLISQLRYVLLSVAEEQNLIDFPSQQTPKDQTTETP